MTCWAIVLAAGESRRMNGENKQFLLIDGIPVLIRALSAFEECAEISGIVVAAREPDQEAIRALCGVYRITKLRAVVTGGATRAESAARAFSEIPEDSEFVAVHDGARPFVTPGLIEAVLDAARGRARQSPLFP